MHKILMAWVGSADLRAPADGATAGIGPTAQALKSRDFDRACLLTNWKEKDDEKYFAWLRKETKSKIEILRERLTSPTNFGEIYEAASRAIKVALGDNPRDVALTFHLSPGTPAMAAVWILLGKTRFPASFIESSREHGVADAAIPFEISVDFIPELLQRRDEALRRGTAAEPPASPEFADIIYRSRVMGRLVSRARKVAAHNVPVLIEGESGTGKEMLARAIHRSSPRRDRELVTVNCGAIPAELIEAQLFGHEKGAFTGAVEARAGIFQAADRSTLFLDEVGELPGPAQVKLLRVLQEGEVVRVGGTKPTKVDVRIIAATNRVLSREIAEGRFRPDLFYRLAVAVLKVPPLRDRGSDLGELVGYLLAKANEDLMRRAGLEDKVLSAGARNLLLNHSWPGNVRELENTIRRAVIWSDGNTISLDDAKEAVLPAPGPGANEILGRSLGEGFQLPDVLKEVARHYLQRAIAESSGNKTVAAELVGLPSYQTLSNWLEKYDVDT